MSINITVADMQSTRVFAEVLRARSKAHEKHGNNSIEALHPSDSQWLPILGEEFGEVCRALTYDGDGSLRAELIDVVSVASAWIDALDREAAKVERIRTGQ